METKIARYDVLARTFGKMGKDARQAASEAADLGKAALVGALPGDAQKNILGEDATGDASCVSGIGEMLFGAAVSVATASPLGLVITGSGMARIYLELGLSGCSDKYRGKGAPVGSFFLEVPYRAGKRAYGYLKSVYRDAERELVEW